MGADDDLPILIPIPRAPSLMEEEVRMRWGPGGRGDYEPLASSRRRMRREPGGAPASTVNVELFHATYLEEGQCITDKDVMVFGHMAIIPYPVLFKCRKVLKRTKTTKIKCKDDKTTSRDVVGRT